MRKGKRVRSDGGQSGTSGGTWLYRRYEEGWLTRCPAVESRDLLLESVLIWVQEKEFERHDDLLYIQKEKPYQ